LTRSKKKPDRRVARTQEALLEAFRDLILTSGYDGMKVGDIIERANVGRSTFYEHFTSKDDILKQSLTAPFAILAGVVGKSHAQPHLELIEERLAAESRGGAKSAVPLRLIATHLAEAQLGLVGAWVIGKPVCSAEALAQALHASTVASVNALLPSRDR